MAKAPSDLDAAWKRLGSTSRRVVQVGALQPQPGPFDPALARFLDDGTEKRVVYVGFGSMPDHTPGELVSLVAEAARSAGVRAVLLSSDANDVDKERDVFVVQRVSHAALFPRMHAIVHHGGAGTTAAALRAAVPQIVVPHFLDQHYWAHRTLASGISAGTIARKHLTAEKLGALLSRATTEGALKDHARALSAETARTDPVARTVALFEELGDSRPTNRPED